MVCTKPRRLESMMDAFVPMTDVLCDCDLMLLKYRPWLCVYDEDGNLTGIMFVATASDYIERKEVVLSTEL